MERHVTEAVGAVVSGWERAQSTGSDEEVLAALSFDEQATLWQPVKTLKTHFVVIPVRFVPNAAALALRLLQRVHKKNLLFSNMGHTLIERPIE
ncbi:hypothetical protein AtubIFM55763_009078 [Aspergillus tubingensis]|nr:hypothetical protein AtubIFM54640_008599 [Aspergillus tubingensis]GLA77193.1 hypothetical protein AtubIFM55763_009078 [Aspergillus tubingensis]GLB23054.1 hypothetical protein AtubIFM61612_003638 [Aspergillus tubingensis]